MADRREDRKAWIEAIGLPFAALAIVLATEAWFSGFESPIVPFLALVLVAIRHQPRQAWVAYGLTAVGYIVHTRVPLVHPVRPAEATPDLLVLLVAGALVIYGQMRTRRIERRASEQERDDAIRLRKFLSTSPDGIWSVDPAGITLHANGPMAEMLGCTPEELIGAHYAPFFTEEGLQAANAAFVRAKSGEPIAFEVTLRRKDGSEVRTICSTHPIFDDAGRFVEGFGILRDITTRHHAEEERQQALSLLEATLESTADGLLVVDDQGRITRFNERFASMWRLPHDILSGGDDERALSFVLSQLEDPEQFLSKVRSLYANPASESFDTLRFLDGRVFERYSMPQRLDGEIVGRVWSFRDVTDRERASEEQRLATEREASIARNLDAALFTVVLSADGRVIRYDYVSEGAEALYGVSRTDLNEDVDFWLKRVHSEDLENVVRPAIDRLLQLLPAVLEVRYQTSKGLHRWHRSHLFPRREAGGEIHVDGIEADVTERVKLEEQLRHAQKMEAIGQLAGGVAHDFNNILTAVIGYSDLLLSRMSEHDPNRHAVEEIRKGGDRAAGLTRQLLTFGRRMSTQPRLVDINHAIRDLEPMLRRLVGEDVTFSLELDPAAGKVRIDPTQFEQVIVNLAVNARDALPQGGRIEIRTDLTERGGKPAEEGLAAGRYVRLWFADSGVGIPEDVLDHIFEPFFTTKDAGRGTGLGLAMVYGIIRQHQGSITVRSGVSQGTQFEILLPEAEGEERPIAPTPSASVGGRERILLVEDDPSLLVLGREILTELGYDVTTARSGIEALELLDQRLRRLDLLVTDVVMPGMGGRALAQEALARYPDLRILFVSGYAGDFRPPLDPRTPNATLLEKPYTPLSLARKVREVLEAASGRTSDASLPR